ncbi:MAG: D-alanine--D-alanine ligase, partial [Nitrospinae bacterium CG11_big_fil_rev_8_21_14_0_20_56_8]
LMEEFKQQVLVEEFIPGREFAVGLLGNRDPEVLPIVEIDFGGDEMAIQSLDDKTRNPRGKLCPAPVDELLKENLGKTAKAAFRALGVYDFSRVDFRLDKNGNLYVLELNSMASLGSSGSYVTSAKAAGYTFESLINRMLDVAVERYFGKQSMEQLAAPEPLLTSLFKRTTTPLHVRIRSYLRGNLGTMEDFLATMVDINSYVHNIEGVNSLGRWVSNQLANLGFQRLVHPRAEFGNMIYFSNHEGEKNDVLIVGHLDNPVHYQDYSSFLEERGRIYGTGVAWGKGGIAVLLGALSALRYTRSLKKVKCGILFITDDSLGGRSSRPLIEELSRNSHYVIGLRGAGLSGELITSCSGTMNFNIEINQVPPRPGRKEGTETHDPVLFAAEKILSLKKLAAQNKGVECTITSVHTRGTGQLPPDYTNLSFLFRFSDTAQSERLETQVNRIFKEGTPGNIKVHLTRGPSRRPFPETEEIRNFYEKVERLARLIEVRVQKTHSPVHSFLSFVPQEIPVLDGLGPVTGGIGGNNEYVIKDSLLDRAVLLANVIFLSNRNFNL